eukprot:m.156273 g.156273  ORF g.156273 m.156273 type:complete len:461 (-) comp9801_c0_seq6:315-1697(-)
MAPIDFTLASCCAHRTGPATTAAAEKHTHHTRNHDTVIWCKQRCFLRAACSGRHSTLGRAYPLRSKRAHPCHTPMIMGACRSTRPCHHQYYLPARSSQLRRPGKDQSRRCAPAGAFGPFVAQTHVSSPGILCAGAARVDPFQTPHSTRDRLQLPAAVEIELRELRAELRRKNASLQAASEELVKQQASHDATLQRCERLQSSHAALESAHADLQANYVALECAHADLQASHATLQANHDITSGYLRDLMAKLNEENWLDAEGLKEPDKALRILKYRRLLAIKKFRSDSSNSSDHSLAKLAVIAGQVYPSWANPSNSELTALVFRDASEQRETTISLRTEPSSMSQPMTMQAVHSRPLSTEAVCDRDCARDLALLDGERVQKIHVALITKLQKVVYTIDHGGITWRDYHRVHMLFPDCIPPQSQLVVARRLMENEFKYTVVRGDQCHRCISMSKRLSATGT